MMGPFFIVFSILPMAILLLAGVWCIRSLWITLMPPRGWKGGKGSAKVRGIGTEPVCEKCRYPVLGLTTFQCPECGTDLRRTGIITRSMEMRRRGGLGAALISLTLVIGLGTAVGLILVAESLGPTSWTGSTNSCVLTPGGASPIRRITVDAYGTGQSTTPYQITFTVEGTARVMYSLNPGGNTLMSMDGSGWTGAFDEPAIAMAFRGAGGDPTTEPGQSQVRELYVLLQNSGQGGAAPFTTSTSSFASASVTLARNTRSDGAFVMWMWIVGFAGLAVWAGLVMLVIRRRKRMLREVDAREAGATAEAPPAPPSPPPTTPPPVPTM